MAIVDHPVITGVTKVYSNNNEDFNENEHHIGSDESNISKDIAICNNEETHKQKHERNVEENSRDTICNGVSSKGENISSNLDDVSSIIVDMIPNDPATENDHLDDETNFNESNQIVKLKVHDEYLSCSNEDNISQKVPSRKFTTLVDSDSEGDIAEYKISKEEFFAVDESKYSRFSGHPQSTKYKESTKIIKSIRGIVDSESEDDEETSNINDSFQTSSKTENVIINGYQTIIDPESEEEKETIDYSAETGTPEIKDIKEKSAKKIKGSIRAAKNEAMHKIYSESQRLLRETGISLPYHRPKQRTLQEFLNRKKLSVSLPKVPSTAAKLKMSSAIVSQMLEEKEKEAEHFYKSSDSEDDTHEATSFTCENMKKSSVTDEEQSVTDVELIHAQNTQNIETNDQDSHGEKEIVQHDDTDLIAHRISVESENSREAGYQDNNNVLLQFPDDIFLPDREKPVAQSNSKFTLKGSPGMIIDLTDDVKPNSKGLSNLLERFFCKHVVNTNKQTDNKSEVTIIHLQDTLNGPIPVKEVLPYKLPADADNPELNKPGAKLMRLKEHLRLQMSLKRNDEWKQKETVLRTQEKEMWNEEEETGHNLSRQEKVDISESSDSGESEPEENDVHIVDKKKKKCMFADDEAEVTDNEDSDVEYCKRSTNLKYGSEKKYKDNNGSDIEEVGEEEQEEEGKEQEEKEEDEEEKEEGEENEKEDRDKGKDTDNDESENEVKSETEFIDEDNDNVDENISVVENEKKRKRLIQKYQDDSEDEDSQSRSIVDTHTFKGRSEDTGWTWENKQQQSEVSTKSQMCKTPMAKTSMLDFVSPITQLSILNTSFDSNKKEHSVDRHEFIFTGNTQSDQSPEQARAAIRNKVISQKKLFYDIEENIDDEYLMQLCSTKFESTQMSEFNSKSLATLNSDTVGSQSGELYNVGGSCAESIAAKELKNSEVENKTSQEKGLFDGSACRIKKIEEVNMADSKLKLKIVSSDNEEPSDEEDTFLKPKKRLAKRLDLSDSEEEDARSCDEESDEEDDADVEEMEEKYIDYDSEENEVVTVPKKDIQKVATDFLEEEAELSGSDWDSADEDEKDLDKLEFEEADEEHLDEDEVKDQLGKIHIKQVLDEDKREVRLLKELLFEDGDLHTDGAGRERKFKWKNIDKLGSDVKMSQMLDENDGWVDLQENEEEAKWNKLRHERDKFLEERMKTLSNEIEDDLCDSQIFKFGLETLKKIKNNESQRQDISPDKVDSFENMEPIMPRNITDLLYAPSTGRKSQTIYNVIKRRSLLTRGEESLARIASLAKQSESTSHTANTRNFVFQYVDSRINDKSKEVETKGERSQNVQNQFRKRRVTSDLTPITKKRRK